MRVPPKYEIVIQGSVIGVIEGSAADRGKHLAYALNRLLTGQEIDAMAFQNSGIAVEIKEPKSNAR